MSNKYKILEILKQKESTVKEIADKTKFNENEVRVYIHRLLKDNLIKEIGKKNRYCIYAAIKKDSNGESIKLLKELYNIMDNKMKPSNPLSENEKNTLIKIMELIQ